MCNGHTSLQFCFPSFTHTNHPHLLPQGSGKTKSTDAPSHTFWLGKSKFYLQDYLHPQGDKRTQKKNRRQISQKPKNRIPPVSRCTRHFKPPFPFFAPSNKFGAKNTSSSQQTADQFDKGKVEKEGGPKFGSPPVAFGPYPPRLSRALKGQGFQLIDTRPAAFEPMTARKEQRVTAGESRTLFFYYFFPRKLLPEFQQATDSFLRGAPLRLRRQVRGVGVRGTRKSYTGLYAFGSILGCYNQISEEAIFIQ